MYGNARVGLGLLLLSLAVSTVARAEPPVPAHPAPPPVHAPIPATPANAPSTPRVAPLAHVAPAVHVALASPPAPPPAHPSTPAAIKLAHEEPRFVSPPHATGYAQRGNRPTPWGDATKLPPTGDQKRLWKIANRQNPGYVRGGSRDFLVDSVPAGKDSTLARHENCVLTSLSFEDSISGHDTVALAGVAAERVTDALYGDTTMKLGPDFATHYTSDAKESVLYAARFPGVTFERADDYHAVAQRLVTSGAGARMVLVGTWKNGSDTGMHAMNMVNLHGEVVVVDAQSGEISTPDTYFKDSTWSKFHFHVTAEGGPGKSPFAQDRDGAAPR